MHSKRICVGNVVFAFESTMPLWLDGNLPLFETDRKDADYLIFVRYGEPGEEMPHAEGYGKVQREGIRFYVALSSDRYKNPTVWHVIGMLPMPRLFLEKGTLMLHASYVLHRGKAVLFSGPCGIGKSTQAALWSRYLGARVVNGDRVLLMPGEKVCLVGSHYFCGTSGICANVTAEVKAIIMLDQGLENRIEKTSPLVLFRQLLAQLNYDTNDRAQLVEVTGLVEALMASTPVYRYSCRMDESAAVDLEKFLYEEF